MSDTSSETVNESLQADKHLSAGDDKLQWCSENVPFSSVIVNVTHRDFTGLEDADLVTRQALINFSYHLTVGNMDDAFRSINIIKRL